MRVIVACLALFLGGKALSAENAFPDLKDGDVVVFVGGQDMLETFEDGWIEAGEILRNGGDRIRFRSLAWEGDTVYFQSTVQTRWRREAFGGWDDQLERIGATVVIAQFGTMESFDGAERVDEFVAAYEQLIGEFSKRGRRVGLVLPGRPRWEHAHVPDFGAYVRAVETIAAERRLPLVEFNESDAAPAPEIIDAVREKNRLWDEYWRPANWKCLFGDDSKRIFSNAAEGLPSFKEEWSTYPALIAAAEEEIFKREPVEPEPAPERTGSAEADIEAELEAFEVLDGFEVGLYADEGHGIANPLSIRWDAAGRAYVTCSDTYPQVEPGVRPNDRIVVLGPVGHEGKASLAWEFADRLNIPTGMEVGVGGEVWVGQGPELLRLRDLRADGFADEYEKVLRGFGNGDSHQTSNSFVWGPAGDLWWCQGDGIESRVETPFGVSSLFQAGVYRLRTRDLELDPLLDDFMGPGNPWGIAFDDFGQSFVIDGAGGISFLTPASIPAKRRLRLQRIGDPGGYCGIECIGTSTFPEEMQGEFLIGDYKKNQVSRFATVEDGAGFKVEWREPLLKSSHRNFRPIDVKIGPDGAAYVVDWYNPITCHQDDFYRHPDRDKTHGRIWRVARKDGSRVRNVIEPSGRLEFLVAMLGSPERWVRMKTKQTLGSRGAGAAEAVKAWARTRTAPRDKMEAVCALEWMGEVDPYLLTVILVSKDHRVRAYGARAVGRAADKLDNWFELLQIAAADDHPRVRMEAVLAAGQVPEARSVLIAAAVAERPMDRWVEYALAQAVYHLKPQWVPAFQRGELDFGTGSGLAAVLSQADSGALLGEARKLVREGKAKGDARSALVRALIAAGQEEADLELVLKADAPDLVLLRGLLDKPQPGFEVEEALKKLAGSGDAKVAAVAIELIGRWRVEDLYGVVSSNVNSPKQITPAVRGAAIGALLETDRDQGAVAAARRLRKSHWTSEIEEVLKAIVSRGAGADVAREIANFEVFSATQGSRVRNAWVASGLVDDALAREFDRLAKFETSEWTFDEGLVSEMALAGHAGDAGRGAELFAGGRLGCSACHRVGDQGGLIGPDLSAVGSGVPPERIVTEVLWPGRQVKEGFVLRRYTKRDGSVIQGYEQAGRDEGVLLVRDFATGEIREIARDELERREEIGSLMPPTAQSLSKGEVADLLAYLYGLRG